MADREKARQRLYDAYGGSHGEDDVADLAALHDAATSFLATLDTYADDELPDDLDPDTKRRLNTARTQLPKAVTGIEKAAEERLDDGE